MAAVAGVDWAGDKHDAMVQDADGGVLWEGTVAHDEAGIARLCATLCSHGVTRVAIERPDGLLVERLLAWSCLHCTPTRSRRRGLASRSPAGSLIASTRWFCASSQGPITIASAP